MPTPGFLSANWQNLVLMSWPVHGDALQPLLPSGVEVDHFDGSAYVSVVGLVVSRWRMLGVPTFSAPFAQINVRFYVRRRIPSGEYRPGVVFIKQLVPHLATVMGARLIYGEPFTKRQLSSTDAKSGLPMGTALHRIEYGWRSGGRVHTLWAESDLKFRYADPESLAGFLTVRHLGYNGSGRNRTREYGVARSDWKVREATDWGVDCDPRELCGQPISGYLESPPASVLIASGGRSIIGWPRRLSQDARNHDTG